MPRQENFTETEATWKQLDRQNTLDFLADPKFHI